MLCTAVAFGPRVLLQDGFTGLRFLVGFSEQLRTLIVLKLL